GGDRGVNLELRVERQRWSIPDDINVDPRGLSDGRDHLLVLVVVAAQVRGVGPGKRPEERLEHGRIVVAGRAEAVAAERLITLRAHAHRVARRLDDLPERRVQPGGLDGSVLERCDEIAATEGG